MEQASSKDPRRKARMVTLQCLFSLDVRRDVEESPLDWLIAENPLPSKAVAFSRDLTRGVRENLTDLDRAIQKYAPAWPVNQLSGVDRNILRIALFELMYCKNTPRKTAINEAVELAKIFGSESSARFVNGVLGSIMEDLQMGELVADQPVPEGR
jgi:transcription antitermination protein NusB